MLDNLVAEQYLEWLTVEDAKRAKKSNYMQEAHWTPVYWAAVDESNLSPYDAIVLGRILGYCQMDKGRCYASLQTIARQCHMSVSSVKRSIKELEDCGYIVDGTPNRIKATHAYEDTGKLDAILKRAGKSRFRES